MFPKRLMLGADFKSWVWHLERDKAFWCLHLGPFYIYYNRWRARFPSSSGFITTDAQLSKEEADELRSLWNEQSRGRKE